ncbi:MAG: hypothetical protein KAI64_06250, partial [Thermoplasmata archaeon]|nr:hypothetical protein [Thermoplasmata archaeon]
MSEEDFAVKRIGGTELFIREILGLLIGSSQPIVEVSFNPFYAEIAQLFSAIKEMAVDHAEIGDNDCQKSSMVNPNEFEFPDEVAVEPGRQSDSRAVGHAREKRGGFLQEMTDIMGF